MGRLFMVGLPGPRVDSVARELVQDLGVGGVVLFARNIESPLQVWELTQGLQRLALAASGRPLLIAVDQEGGPVQRLKAPLTLIPSARELGQAWTPAQVESLCRQVGRELCLLGVNVNLAPVLDVARGPECPMWERSFGPDPQKVAELGAAALQGYLAGGVLPVAKHFPGLGDTKRDSHKELPLALSQDASREVDLLPFRRAVAAGAPMIMTAHLLVSPWEARPATLSAVAIQGWLRQELGFKGVVMTDDLEMGAIAQETTVPGAAWQALMAGADLLLICQDHEKVWEAARLLKDLTSPFRLKQASQRLNNLTLRLGSAAADQKEILRFLENPAILATP